MPTQENPPGPATSLVPLTVRVSLWLYNACRTTPTAPEQLQFYSATMASRIRLHELDPQLSSSSLVSGGRYMAVASATNGTDTTTVFRVFNVDYDPAKAVFVSTSGSDTNNGLCPVGSGDNTCSGTGTMGAVKSVNAGVWAAKANGRSTVVMATGSYPAAKLGANATVIAVRGGYNSSSWLRAGTGTKSTIEGDGVGIEATAGANLRLEQLNVESGSPKGIGGASAPIYTDSGQSTPAWNAGTGSPRAGVQPDYFSVRHTVTFNTPAGGYRLHRERGH